MRLQRAYAKQDFLAEHLSDPGSRRLADELAAEVQKVLHDVIKSAVSQIVEQLNADGHDLRYYDEPVPGMIALRDDAGDGANYRCDLRLAVDTVISVGFRDTAESSAAEESSV